MPYIKPEQRLSEDERDFLFRDFPIHNAGELNYRITLLINDYWLSRVSYQGVAEITGVLENVKQEFYRRIVAPYEDDKLKLNGDVY